MFLPLAAWLGMISWQPIAPVVMLLLANCILNVPYWYAGRRAGFPLSHFYVHWGIDLVILTSIVYALGGIDVPLVQFAYLVMILVSALFVSQRTAFFLATGATVAYSTLGLIEMMGIVPSRPGMWAHHYSTEIRVFIIGTSVVFFYVFAYLAGTLSELLRQANEELSSTRALVQEQNRLLEDRVRERTRDLEARTLELQERTEELEELVHIVTHDLQNVAVASTETARKLVELDGPQLSTRGQRYADRLIRDCRLMATMLRNLLEVVSQTEVAEHREHVDVAAVVAEAVARAHTAVENKHIQITVGDLPPVAAEYQKIHHVFENLLTNACKYVGDKPLACIEIGGSAHNGTVEYFVRDNGVGIDATQLDRIFQLYHRAPDQTVGGVVQEGHGIGLAVVKRIVQRYGGRIWVESVPGEGTCFRVSFPREEKDPV
ncbi:MAG: hypothetical protein HY271_17360 [Deltaproteobacteria bacterium]|nr:hypothetical protein [Deltaproteobacteria bacterium]